MDATKANVRIPWSGTAWSDRTVRAVLCKFYKSCSVNSTRHPICINMHNVGFAAFMYFPAYLQRKNLTEIAHWIDDERQGSGSTRIWSWARCLSHIIITWPAMKQRCMALRAHKRPKSACQEALHGFGAQVKGNGTHTSHCIIVMELYEMMHALTS